MSIDARPRPAADVEPLAHEEVYTVVAAACAFAAGAIHLAVVPAHWGVSVPISAFFIALGLGQLILGAALRWRLPPLFLRAGIFGPLGGIVPYRPRRTVDLPFLPP